MMWTVGTTGKKVKYGVVKVQITVTKHWCDKGVGRGLKQ